MSLAEPGEAMPREPTTGIATRSALLEDIVSTTVALGWERCQSLARAQALDGVWKHQKDWTEMNTDHINIFANLLFNICSRAPFDLRPTLSLMPPPATKHVLHAPCCHQLLRDLRSNTAHNNFNGRQCKAPCRACRSFSHVVPGEFLFPARGEIVSRKKRQAEEKLMIAKKTVGRKRK